MFRNTACMIFLAALAAACSGQARSPRAELPPSWRMILIAPDGDGDLERQIARQQDEIRKGRDPVPHLERLGFLFVAKARTAFDSGCYKLAERCADCIDERAPGDPSAALLRGHVLHALHRFADAERIARELVARRGDFLDHGLLGDVLLDRGDLDGALECYQKMLDLRPCLQSYARGARGRWLRGDLEGARTLMRLAVSAGSRRDPEPLCWSFAQLAELEHQAGDAGAAREAARSALAILPDYAPALLALGRIELAAGEASAAVEALRKAVAVRPEPEYGWALADALGEQGLIVQAGAVEAELERSGEREDPRTFALYLASRGRRVERALQLARAELEVRADSFTHDAHAWALLAAGEPQRAAESMQRALARGAPHARLSYHAAAIALAVGEREQARAHFDAAARMQHVLLPSERRDLQRRREQL
jgi:tetratricopeptide (TPR) repeat protein